MNKFKESLRVELIDSVEEQYKKQGKKLEFKDKVALAVYDAILDVPVQNQEEMLMRTEMVMNINKYICNYEELRPVLTRYFEEKSRKEKWER